MKQKNAKIDLFLVISMPNELTLLHSGHTKVDLN